MDDNKAVDIKKINDKIEKESAFIDLLMMEINKVIVGQKHMTERLLIGFNLHLIFCLQTLLEL